MTNLHVGHVLDALAELESESVQCVVTSPPYWGLRDYGLKPTIWGAGPGCKHDWDDLLCPAANGIIHDGGMSGETLSGKSATRRPRRSTRCHTCGAWRGCLGLEPTPELYVAHMVDLFGEVRRVLRGDGTLWLNLGDCYSQGTGGARSARRDRAECCVPGRRSRGLPPKSLMGMPWRVALALQADGWILRQEIIWHKPNPMPESCRDEAQDYYDEADTLNDTLMGIGGGE